MIRWLSISCCKDPICSFSEKMVNGRLYSRILKRRLEAVNLEPIFKFWPNLIMTHYKKNFQKVVTSFNDITKTGYFLLKFPTSSNWPKSLGNQSSRASWISTKFGIWITNTCGNVIEGFKNFQLLYGANQEVKKSKNNLNAIFWLFFYIYIYSRVRGLSNHNKSWQTGRTRYYLFKSIDQILLWYSLINSGDQICWK